jgi:hypothetical protein
MQPLRALVILIATASSIASASGQAPAPAPSPSPQPPQRTAAPSDARVYFISPTNGARIRGAVIVRFGLRNMGVTRAGDNAPNVGHHHLLVDVKEPLSPAEPIPTDRAHLHFGGGQTETRLELAPGRHTLQLVLGDHQHRLFNPVVSSEKIEILVLSPKPRVKRRGRRG